MLIVLKLIRMKNLRILMKIVNRVYLKTKKIPRSVSSIWAERRRAWKSSHYAFTWSRTSTSSFRRRRWRHPVSAPTSTLSSTSARTLSTFVCASIPSTSSVSTRCCRVQAPIVCKLVWEVLSVSHWAQLPVSTSVSHSCQSVLRTQTRQLALRPLDVQSSSFQEGRRYESIYLDLN